MTNRCVLFLACLLRPTLVEIRGNSRTPRHKAEDAEACQSITTTAPVTGSPSYFTMMLLRFNKGSAAKVSQCSKCDLPFHKFLSCSLGICCACVRPRKTQQARNEPRESQMIPCAWQPLMNFQKSSAETAWAGWPRRISWFQYTCGTGPLAGLFEEWPVPVCSGTGM